MKHLKYLSHFINETVEVYDWEFILQDLSVVKYKFLDSAANEYLVEFNKIGRTNNYELFYYVKHGDAFSVSKIVNVNPYRVIKTVFTSIIQDFVSRVENVNSIVFKGVAKDFEKEFLTSRTKVYLRYLTRNPIAGFNVEQFGNEIKLKKQSYAKT